MSLQSIIIYDFEELFNILNEIKENLNFKIFNINSKNKPEIFREQKFGNFLVLTKEKNNLKKTHPNINSKKIIIFNNYPIKIDKLIETLNVTLLKQKYNFQSEIKLQNYMLDLNSRIIKKDTKKLKLTEKEIDIILFLKSKNNSQKIEVLQKEVWGYALELETHTVETHVYRLRKKINDKFNDENFIVSNKYGYRFN